VESSYPVSSSAAKSAAHFLETFEELAREKVSQLLQVYLDQEVDELLHRARYERRESGTPVAYRDGHDEVRTFTTGAGALKVARPRVRGMAYESAVLPRYQRRSATLNRAMHALWIEGLATRDVEPALRALLGADAPLSASTVTRTNAKFFSDYEDWSVRSLAGADFVYLWVDGIFLGAGPSDERRVILTVLGSDLFGKKHLLALSDAMSESELSWGEVFEDLKARGLPPPSVIIADGADGIWAAATKAFPDALQQRCWFHKIQNVLDKVPERKKDEVKIALHEAMYAETKECSQSRMEDLAVYLEASYPKAASCVRDDMDRLFSFYAFPSENWKSIRTNNPLESVFSSVRLRTEAAKRMRTGKSATYLVFALMTRLSANWNRISGHEKIAPFFAAKRAVAA
jgi:putative transposase